MRRTPCTSSLPRTGRSTAGSTLHQPGGGSSPNSAADAKPRGSFAVRDALAATAESIQDKGAEFSYALRYLHTSDPRDEPQTELEQRGLSFVASHPTQNYYAQEMLGGRRYFTAVYPDNCQVGQSAGGIVVRVPLEF